MVEITQFPEMILASLIRTLPTRLFIQIIEDSGETLFKGYVEDLLESPVFEDIMGSEVYKSIVKDNGLILELF